MDALVRSVSTPARLGPEPALRLPGLGRHVVVIAAVLLLPRRAAAENVAPPGETMSETEAQIPATKTSFYGWEILGTGEVGAVLAAAAVLFPSEPVTTPLSTVAFVVGTPAYVLGGPIIHWSHDSFGKGLISLGANLFVPLTAAFVGQAVNCPDVDPSPNCASRGFFHGFALAALVVPVVDALTLGWEQVPVDDAGRGSPRAGAPSRPGSIAPTWSYEMGATRRDGHGTGAWQLGVAGTF